MSESYTVKCRSNGKLIPMTITPEENRLYLSFRYDVALKDEIKAMSGARWEPDSKRWFVTNNQRNLFALQFLCGGNPYANWEKPLIDFKPRRPWLMSHQFEMAATALTRHYCILACEMGTGKTLTMIEALEQSGTRDWWWVGPRNAVFSVKNEFKKWAICDKCLKPSKRIYIGSTIIDPCTCAVFLNHGNVVPRFLSYEELKKEIDQWGDKKPPQGVVFDESSRGKNGTAQRTMAMQALADDIRDKWKFDGFVVEMSGSPAPKDPSDWYSQCEIAQPGYIREGNVHKFRQRLCVIEQRENNITGGSYPHLITWLDNPAKCNQCGQIENHPAHNLGGGGHSFVKSRDEVSYLYKRMSGLVLVKLKKDVLDLPEKNYELIELQPTNEMKRSAAIIEARCPTTIQCLTLLRELSDGFQYKDEDIGQSITCPRCHGTKLEETFFYCGPDERYDEVMLAQSLGNQIPNGMFEKREQTCENCGGEGQVVKLQRVALEVPTPKEAALRAQLDLNEEIGRIVIFAGFTGSIDRIVAICKSEGWDVICCDGRGFSGTLSGSPEKLLEMFQDKEITSKIAFVAHPASGGLGLNLTAASTIVYWSNDFNAESRIQSEDRIHRPGMDTNRGAKIVDLLCLKSDMLVLNNLKRKRRLQDLTLGQMSEEIKAIRFSDIREY